MATVEDEIIAAGAQIIWVLESNSRGQPGTAEDCRNWIASRGGTRGLCVGDAQTEPVAQLFDKSPFAIGRGFDMVIPRDTMVIEYVTTHGTPSGNDNLDGQAVLDQIKRITGR